MKKINVKHITHLNNESLRGLDFYQLEISFLQERLDEINGDNTSTEVRQQIDHFQNQLFIHRNAIDELKSLISDNNRSIELQLAKSEPFVDESLGQEHERLNADYLTEEKMFNDLRRDFNRFAAEWM